MKMDALTVQELIDLLGTVEDKSGNVRIDGCDCCNPAVGISIAPDGIIIANDITARDYDDLQPSLGRCSMCFDRIPSGDSICEDCAWDVADQLDGA